MSDWAGLAWIIILVVLCIVYSGCGPTSDDWMHYWYDTGTYAPAAKYDETLVPYLDEFLADAERHGAHVDNKVRLMVYSDLDEPMVGLCKSYWRDGDLLFGEVYINPVIKNPYRLKALMYHEFGHCVLGLGHSDAGIMQPKLQDPVYYRDNWGNLVGDLFR